MAAKKRAGKTQPPAEKTLAELYAVSLWLRQRSEELARELSALSVRIEEARATAVAAARTKRLKEEERKGSR